MAEQKINWFGTTSIRLHLPLVWVCVAAIIVGVLIYKFANASGDRAVYIFIASALGILTGIITLLARLYQSERQLEQTRRTAALDFILRWTDPKFDNIRRQGRGIYEALREEREKSNSETQLYTELRKDRERWENFIDVANFFEVLGIALHHEQVNEKIIKDFFRGIIVQYWNAFKPLVEARRIERENPRIYEWFERLHDKSGT